MAKEKALPRTADLTALGNAVAQATVTLRNAHRIARDLRGVLSDPDQLVLLRALEKDIEAALAPFEVR